MTFLNTIWWMVLDVLISENRQQYTCLINNICTLKKVSFSATDSSNWNSMTSGTVQIPFKPHFHIKQGISI